MPRTPMPRAIVADFIAPPLRSALSLPHGCPPFSAEVRATRVARCGFEYWSLDDEERRDNYHVHAAIGLVDAPGRSRCGAPHGRLNSVRNPSLPGSASRFRPETSPRTLRRI